MGNFKWGDMPSKDDRPLRTCLIVSRNKDNASVKDFKQRRHSFITKDTDDELRIKFKDFVRNGKPGEFCRLYVSVNTRDEEALHTELQVFLARNRDFNLVSLPVRMVGLAQQKECALSKRWMFDFDSQDETLLNQFIDDIKRADSNVDIEVHPTPHGFAVVTSRGFDAYDRQTKTSLVDKYKDVAGLHRDGMLCIDWATS